jgi:hypothetical protein
VFDKNEGKLGSGGHLTAMTGWLNSPSHDEQAKQNVLGTSVPETEADDVSRLIYGKNGGFLMQKDVELSVQSKKDSQP